MFQDSYPRYYPEWVKLAEWPEIIFTATNSRTKVRQKNLRKKIEGYLNAVSNSRK